MKKKLLILVFFGAVLMFPFSVVGQSKGGTRSRQTAAYGTQKKASGSHKSVKKKMADVTVSDPTGEIKRIGYVDLGLPSGTLWARCNLGDVYPRSFGHSFAWGKPELYFGGVSKADGLDIEDISGNREYDAATYQLGEPWQMPTYEQWVELIDNCKWQWSTIGGGYEGFKIIGPNGNSIFLPPAGWTDGRNIVDAHKKGYYWSSTPYPGNRVIVLMFDKTGPTTQWDYRSTGYSVRPVINKGSKLESK